MRNGATSVANMAPSMSLQYPYTTGSMLIVPQIEQAIGQRPQFTGDALSMRQQYKAFADQANSSCKKSANLSIGK